MLKIHFINVGDGDAALVEDFSGEVPFRMLIDTGRNEVPGEGRACIKAADYLRELGIDQLDLLMITHLHLDHFEGLYSVLEQTRIRTAWIPYLPAEAPEYRPAESEIKAIRGLGRDLRIWQKLVNRMRGLDVELISVVGSHYGFRLTEGLKADLIVPSVVEKQGADAVYNSMMKGIELPDDLLYWASKRRNPGSLRLMLCKDTDEGVKKALFGADCFGAVWERETSFCDILKVPHHGDRKAISTRMVENTKPKIAVISCDKDYIERKDRPSTLTIASLLAVGADVWFTDEFSYNGLHAKRHRAVIVEIGSDGKIRVLEAPAPERT